MKTCITLIMFSLLLSCNSGLQKYYDTDSRFYPIEPDVSVYYDKERHGYYKVIYFDRYYEFSHPMYASIYNTKINKGYHLFDNSGYNGFDFEHTFKSEYEAIKHAKTCGGIYFFNLGGQYQFHDGALYKTSPFMKLQKK